MVLSKLTISEISEKLDKKEISSVELTQEVFKIQLKSYSLNSS